MADKNKSKSDRTKTRQSESRDFAASMRSDGHTRSVGGNKPSAAEQQPRIHNEPSIIDSIVQQVSEAKGPESDISEMKDPE